MKDIEYTVIKDNKIITIPTVNDLCESINIKFNKLLEENNRLHEQVDNYNKELYENEKYELLFKQYKKLEQDYYRGFGIDEDEDKQINTAKEQWISRNGNTGTWTYQFNPTALGTIGILIAPDGQKFVFRDI